MIKVAMHGQTTLSHAEVCFNRLYSSIVFSHRHSLKFFDMLLYFSVTYTPFQDVLFLVAFKAFYFKQCQ